MTKRLKDLVDLWFEGRHYQLADEAAECTLPSSKLAVVPMVAYRRMPSLLRTHPKFAKHFRDIALSLRDPRGGVNEMNGRGNKECHYLTCFNGTEKQKTVLSP